MLNFDLNDLTLGFLNLLLNKIDFILKLLEVFDCLFERDYFILRNNQLLSFQFQSIIVLIITFLKLLIVFHRDLKVFFQIFELFFKLSNLFFKLLLFFLMQSFLLEFCLLMLHFGVFFLFYDLLLL